MDILIQQELDIALKDKPKEISNKDGIRIIDSLQQHSFVMAIGMILTPTYFFRSVCFSINIFWKIDNFLKNIFLKTISFFSVCILTTLKMGLKMFSSIWYVQNFYNISSII